MGIWLHRFSLLLTVVGVFVATVLSLAHGAGAGLPCGDAGGCAALAARPESRWFGLPVAYFGLAAYLGLFGLMCLQLFGDVGKRPLWVKVGAVATGFGFVMSVGLVLTLLFHLRLQCEWCFASAATMTLLFACQATLLRLGREAKEAGTWEVMVAPFLLVAALGGAYGVGQGSRTMLQPKEVPGIPLAQILPLPAYAQGPESAPVTLVEVADFFCPACRVTWGKLAEYRKKYPSQVRVAFRSMPLFQLEGHEASLPAALAAEYAAENGKYWPFVEAMFSSAGEHAKSPERIAEVLDQVGLSGKDWLGRYQDPNEAMFKSLNAVMDLLVNNGVTSTPMYLVFLPGRPAIATSALTLEEIMNSPEVRVALGSPSEAVVGR